MRKFWILAAMMMAAVFSVAPVATAEVCEELQCAPHSADVDGNFSVGMSELLRVIQLYNMRSYHCDLTNTSEDGYTPGPGCVEEDTTPPVVTLNGNSNVTIEACSDYTELGVTATDAVDGSVAVEIYGIVDETMPDIYTITYTAEDNSGNTASVTRTVNIVDTTAPVVTLTGPATADTMQGETYNDPGASATDGCRGFGHITWETMGFVNTATPGVYVLTYTATDDFGNDASVSRTVTVVEAGEGEGELDTEAPVINVDGPLALTIECGQDYVDGTYVTDDSGEASLFVKTLLGDAIVPPVDGHTVGVFTIEYRAEDAAGNHAPLITRTVTVEDTTAPVVTLNGPATVEIEQGESFTDLGATATDTCDDSLTVVIAGDVVNTAVLGTYAITYNTTDASGNAAAQVTRVVTVTASSELKTAYYVPVGVPATLEVPAVSGATYQWQYSGNIAAPDGTWANMTNMVGTVGGATTNRLNFAAVQTSDGKWYRCMINGVASPVIYLFPEQNDMVWIDFSRIADEQPKMTVAPATVDRFLGAPVATVIGVTLYLERAPWVLNAEVDITSGAATVTLGDFDVDFDGGILYFEVYGKTSSGAMLTPDLNYFGLTSPNGDRVTRMAKPADGAYNFALPWTQVGPGGMDAKSILDAILGVLE